MRIILAFAAFGASTAFCAQVSEPEIRAAVTKSIALLQHTGKVWFEKQTCVSCHHQGLPMTALRMARERGIAVDEALARDSAGKAFAFLQSLDRAVQNSHMIDPAGDNAMQLIAASDAGVPPSLTTSVYARLLANRQEPDGRWITIDNRPPSSHSQFTTTALAIRALRLHLPARLEKEKAQRVERARRWLLGASPGTTEDRTFQLLGLGWAGAAEPDRKRAAARLLAEQRPDGGWAQLPGMPSDAYATGQVLAAVYEAGAVPVSDPAYQRGLRFLLESRKPDGSWMVKTRLVQAHLISPPYFETGFPHGKDQIISCLATTWASIALMHALPRGSAKPLPAVDAPARNTEPWMEVALFGTAKELGALLDRGLDPNSKTKEGTTALMMAADNLEKVKLLSARRAAVKAESKTRYTALMAAASLRGTTEVVRFLLDKGADAGTRIPRPLFNASPVFFAAWSGDTAMAELLLSKGAGLDQDMLMLGLFSVSPLRYALWLRDSAMVTLLNKHGQGVNTIGEGGYSLLTDAVFANNIPMARTLIGLGAKVNEVDKLGMTPLIHAASIDFGDGEMARLLLQAGAQVSAKSKEGLTAVQLAGKYQHRNVLRALEGK